MEEKQKIRILKKKRLQLKKENLFRLELKLTSEKEYEYAYGLLCDIRDINFFKILIDKYPQFVNIVDKDKNTLLYNIIFDYLNTEDSFYLTAIGIIISSPNFKMTEKDYNLIDELKENPSGKNFGSVETVRRLNDILDYYKKSRLNLPQTKIKIGNNPDRIDYFDRKDLTALNTFTIGIPNMAFSFEQDQTETKLYIHIIDLDEYILNSQDGEDYALYHMFGEIFSDDIKDVIELKRGNKKLTFTVELTYDENNKPKDKKIYQSVIAIDKNYRSNNPEVGKFIKKLRTIIPNIGWDIKHDLKSLFSKCIMEYALKNRKPIILKNIYVENNLHKSLMRSDTTKFTKRMWRGYDDLSYLLELLEDSDVAETIYSDTEDFSALSTTCDIVEQGSNYVALMNLRILKSELEEIRQLQESSEKAVVLANAIKK